MTERGERRGPPVIIGMDGDGNLSRRPRSRRRRRKRGLLRDLVGDFSDRRFGIRWTARLSATWTAACFAAWIGMAVLSERFLPATVFLYGPRFLILLPIALLAPMALIAAPRWLLVQAFSLIVALGPVIGMRLSGATLQQREPPLPRTSETIRLLTYNTQGGAIVAQNLPVIVERYAPDVMAFQECGEELATAVRALSGWSTVIWQSLCLASRWPITSIDSMPRGTFEATSAAGLGGAGLVLRSRLAHPAGPFELVNLHLETARKGLEGLLAEPQEAAEIPRAEVNARIRSMESERAALWSRKQATALPLVIVGDFNLPVESRIYRQFWSSYDNAFERAGTGLGFTKHEGRWLHIRIDHVLMAPGTFEARGAWVGLDLGSDHLPMIADLVRMPR